QRGGQVALPEVGDHHDDGLAGELLAGPDPGGGLDGRSGGDPDHQTLPAGDVPGTLHRGGGVDVDHLVVGLAVQDAGHEVRPQALDLVGAGLAAVEDRGLFRLDGDDLDLGLAFIAYLAEL